MDKYTQAAVLVLLTMAIENQPKQLMQIAKDCLHIVKKAKRIDLIEPLVHLIENPRLKITKGVER